MTDRHTAPIHFLRYSEGSSDKFYLVCDLSDATPKAIIAYGRVGSSGAWSTVSEAEGNKKLNEKLKKGYKSVSAIPSEGFTAGIVEYLKEEVLKRLLEAGVDLDDVHVVRDGGHGPSGTGVYLEIVLRGAAKVKAASREKTPDPSTWADGW